MSRTVKMAFSVTLFLLFGALSCEFRRVEVNSRLRGDFLMHFVRHHDFREEGGEQI